ncbi:DUF3153 domain-containing protein [Longimycelium tulufanense]|uniref:DUF3153 domain-containing protein n=2 Tax=Longimycelium tulufanense TaxID=907463 RepID=A0A8J3FV97_9PSEU|nr:DUF3153 domain-containing protein [Longimycelium tulufanense]
MVLPLLLVIGVLAGGCVRVRATMAVSEDDRVSGEIVVGALPSRDGDPGPQLRVPPGMERRVRVQPHEADGYHGSRLSFEGLSFDELRLLADRTTELPSRYDLSLRRSGDLVTLTGSVDLTKLPPDRTDVRIRVSFPGEIAHSNGDERAGTVSWRPAAGEVTEFVVTAPYAGMAASWIGWAVLVGVACSLAALVVALLAIHAHRQHRAEEAREKAEGA